MAIFNQFVDIEGIAVNPNHVVSIGKIYKDCIDIFSFYIEIVGANSIRVEAKESSDKGLSDLHQLREDIIAGLNICVRNVIQQVN